MSKIKTKRMTRSQKVREVYRELRLSVQGKVSARELLHCAAALVESYDDDVDHSCFELRSGGLPFECQALDVAFADGGWRVMNYEESRQDELLRSETMEVLMHNGWARLGRHYAE